jgi:Matrixin
MTATRTVATIVVVGALAGLVAPVTRAYNTFGKWGKLNVPFYVNPANADVSQNAAISALQTGMNVWNTQSGTPFRFSYAGQVGTTSIGFDKKNVMVFRKVTNGGAIASTYAWAQNGYLVDTDIIFWDGGFKFFTGSGGCSGGVYVEDIAAHELGHSMGLSHSSVSEATMYGSYSTCSMAKRTLASDDIAGAKKLYGSQ